MERSQIRIEEDRKISSDEVAIVEWLLNHAEVGEAKELRPTVRHLRVKGRCACGCASVDFISLDKQGSGRVLVDATGKDSHGRECGVILFVLDGQISGLEIYEHEPDSARELPAIESLRLWGAA